MTALDDLTLVIEAELEGPRASVSSTQIARQVRRGRVPFHNRWTIVRIMELYAASRDDVFYSPGSAGHPSQLIRVQRGEAGA